MQRPKIAFPSRQTKKDRIGQGLPLSHKTNRIDDDRCQSAAAIAKTEINDFGVMPVTRSSPDEDAHLTRFGATAIA
jgi:hypothetical protein